MKNPVILSTMLFIMLASGCSTLNGSASANKKTPGDSIIDENKKVKVEPARYVQILDELISNGCDISMFEMAERNKVFDMKVACK